MNRIAISQELPDGLKTLEDASEGLPEVCERYAAYEKGS
jgi:hypothetical protein